MRALVLSILLTLGAAVGLSRLVAGPARESLVERTPRAELHWPDAPDFAGRVEAAAPEMVVLGNSVVDAALDRDLLTELTGREVLGIPVHGSASAMWYLLLKNVVVPSPARPRYVMIGFRHVFLTEPDYRTTGPYRIGLNWFSQPNEPLLDRLAYLRDRSELELLALEHASIWQRRAELRTATEDFVKDDLAACLLGLDPAAMRGAVDRVFAPERKRSEAVTEAQTRAEVQIERYHFDFESQLSRSFLPEIVRLCDENDIQLVLLELPVRMTYAPDASPPAWVRDWLPEYMDDLYAWLDERDVPVLDFDGDERVQFEWFAEGDHMDMEVGRPPFTAMVAERLRPLFDGDGR